MKRRRFLSIAAGLTAASAFRAFAAPSVRQWHGVALGSAAAIAVNHPDADRLIALARSEIDRLENIFSLYRADSVLSQLNRDGKLTSPPFELLNCLSLCDTVNRASGGLFDPTVQPLWSAYATSWSGGKAPARLDLEHALALTGWSDVQFDADKVSFARPEMALTLNGIAQGFIADRVTLLLRSQGLSDVLVDTGEIRALGTAPGTMGWPVNLQDGPRITLRDRAVATSSLRGTVIDPAGRVGHILDPSIGALEERPANVVSISAPTAALADALSTAACLMLDQDEAEKLVRVFLDAELLRFGT